MRILITLTVTFSLFLPAYVSAETFELGGLSFSQYPGAELVEESTDMEVRSHRIELGALEKVFEGPVKRRFTIYPRPGERQRSNASMKIS